MSVTLTSGALQDQTNLPSVYHPTPKHTTSYQLEVGSLVDNDWRLATELE